MLELFVLGHLDHQLASVCDADHITKVNLSALKIGDYQDNQLAESRIYFSNLPTDSKARYFGFVTHRWEQKYPHLPKLQDLHKIPFERNVVYVAQRIPTREWWEGNNKSCPGMEKYLLEFMEMFHIPRLEGFDFFSNQFICYRSHYYAFQVAIRKAITYFHKKYRFAYDYDVGGKQYECRRAACVYEYFTALYFANTDLTIRQIPSGTSFP